MNHERPYDVAVIIRAICTGGAERHTAELVNYLAESGLRVVLFQGGFDLRSLGAKVVPGHLDIVNFDLPTRKLSAADLQAWARLFHANAFRCALVVTIFPADVGWHRVLRKATHRIYHFEHGLIQDLPPRVSRWHFGVVPGLGVWWYRLLWDRSRVGRMVDRVLTNSKAAKERLVKMAFVSIKKIGVFPNGVNVTHWVPDVVGRMQFRKAHGIPKDRFLFGTVSRLVPEKGLDLAIRAFARLCQDTPADIGLCIIGEGPLEDELKRLTREVGLEGRVVFCGFVVNVRAAYSALNALLQPSVTESCPLAVLEALACGCRVIASPVGGVPEILETPACGDLVASRDPGKWAAAMRRRLQTPPEEEADLARRAREVILANHDQRRQFQWVADEIGALELAIARSKAMLARHGNTTEEAP
jgi:glycosyltransferase involved in cell wall biosynthesis